MLPSSSEEREDITLYFLSQSPNSEVAFLQKVYSESLMGHRHDVWDVHATDGRWWIITNPTNLYSQAQFPNLDLAITFHMGLCLRVPRTEQQKESDQRVLPIAPVLLKLREATDALSQANSVLDYQAVGMRCREILLAFVHAVQELSLYDDSEPAPKKSDFRAWSDIFCKHALSGSAQKERRHLIKTLLVEAWTFSNWLTHSRSATWYDAETALTTTEHIVGLSSSLLIRHTRHVPDECPICGSSNLEPQEGTHQSLPDVVWERPCCSDCGWVGPPVPICAPAGSYELITSTGTHSDECGILHSPLSSLKRPE